MQFILITLIFCALIHYEIRKSSRKKEQMDDDFWEYESQSYFARPVDLSNINYLKVPLESLPFLPDASGELLNTQNQVKELAGQNMLNLNGLTNTEIRYRFGAKNYDHMAACDQKFLLFIRTLGKWGSLLYENNHRRDAVTVLEYAVSCGSDISQTYLLLAKLYAEEREASKIEKLAETYSALNTLMKESTLQKMRQYL